MNIATGGQIFLKDSTVRFQENLFRRSRIAICGQVGSLIKVPKEPFASVPRYTYLKMETVVLRKRLQALTKLHGVIIQKATT